MAKTGFSQDVAHLIVILFRLSDFKSHRQFASYSKLTNFTEYTYNGTKIACGNIKTNNNKLSKKKKKESLVSGKVFIRVSR